MHAGETMHCQPCYKMLLTLCEEKTPRDSPRKEHVMQSVGAVGLACGTNIRVSGDLKHYETAVTSLQCD